MHAHTHTLSPKRDSHAAGIYLDSVICDLPLGPLLSSLYHFTVVASPQSLMLEEEEQQ